MHRRQDATALDQPLVTFGLVLGDAHADQRSDQTADHRPSPNAGERGHDGSSRDERSEAWNGEGANAREQAEGSANYSAGSRAGSGPFRRLGVPFVSKLLSAQILRQ